MFKNIFIFLSFSISLSAFALTPLNAQNVLGKYDMKGIVHLKAEILPNNKIEAVQVGIFTDTYCSGTYKYLIATNEVEANLDCEGDRLYQRINLQDKYVEDLEEGTTVNVYLEYKNDKYNFDFDVIKEQSFLE
jgi:hypothetical protein